MRFVPVKTADSSGLDAGPALRDGADRNRTQLSNAIRGYGGGSPYRRKGKAHLAPSAERIHADESLPGFGRELFAAQAKEYAQLQAQIDEVDAGSWLGITP